MEDIRDPACTRVCKYCKVLKPVEDFHWVSNRGAERKPSQWCKLCWNERARKLRELETPEARQARQRARLFKRLGEPNPGDILCIICEDGLGTHANHDHRCCPGPHGCPKCFRGWLCANCNSGLGFFRDNEQHLISAVKYLRRYNARRLT